MSTEGYKRKLTAILSADVEGYSRLMGEDEDATIRTLTTYRELMTTLIQKHRGRVVDSPGDNLLAEFLSVVDAVRCAVEIQEELRVRNAELPENRRMHFRIGINLGDVVQEEERIYGDGINIAARVEGLAEGGGICISGTVYDSIKNKLSLTYESLGEHTVKNITEPVRVYRMRVGPEAAVQPSPRYWHKAALAALVVLIVAAGAWAIWNFYFRPPPIEPASVEKMAYPLPDKPSIAVLPFANMSGDPAQDYFSDGITDQIISTLSMLRGLFVISRSSMFTYKGKPVKVQKVAEDLGVKYVLEGSVQRSADRVRITAQLIDATTGHHIWSEGYDREPKDIFAIQDDITIKVTSALRVELTDGEQARLWDRNATTNLRAWEKFLQGIDYLYRYTKEDNATARRLYEEAIALDPKYVNAYAVLGWTHFFDARFGWVESRAESIKTALKYAQKTIELNDTSDLGYGLIGGVYFLQGQYEKAIAEGERAVALNPNGAMNYSFLAGVVGCSGKWDESIELAKKSIRLQPFSPASSYHWLGRAYFMTGRLDESIITWKKALHVNPNYLPAHAFLAACYSSLDRHAEASAAAKEVLRINPKFNVESFAKHLPYKEKFDIERVVAALQKAGLPETPALPLPDKPSIAVLPFTNMSDDPKQEYFSDGITEEIITALSKTPKLFVIARNSTFTYKNKSAKVQKVGRELGVKYVLEGSVRKAAHRVRITAQLLDARTGHHLWAERYDRDLKDIFAIQDDITMKIMTAIRVKLTEGEQARIFGKGTDNLEAYLKILQAREHFFRMNKQGSMRARQLAKEAIALDPEYAGPYTILALTHMMDLWFKFSESPKVSMKLAVEAAQKALTLDDSAPSTHVGLCMLYIMQRQHDKAIAAGERAVALSPSGASAYSSLATAFTYAGRYKEAISLFEKAISLNPFPTSIYLRDLGHAYRMAGRNEEAIAEYEKSLQKNPDDLFTHLGLAVAYVSLGREEKARAEAAEVLRIHPKFSLKHYAKTLPLKNQADVDYTISSLRKAGLK